MRAFSQVIQFRSGSSTPVVPPLSVRKRPAARLGAEADRPEREKAKRATMSGSAYNAFKARVPIAWSPRLFITLVRGLPGTRRLHRRTLDAMRLRRCHRTVAHRNTPSLLGMLNQVKRLVAIETEEMYNARKLKEAQHRALRPPIVVSHAPPPPPPQ